VSTYSKISKQWLLKRVSLEDGEIGAGTARCFMLDETDQAILKLNKHNKRHLLTAVRCGCYFCKRIYHPAKIKDWVDRKRTALCPYCCVDAVLPHIKGGCSVSAPLLERLHDAQFGTLEVSGR